jgi:hypothetical protein
LVACSSAAAIAPLFKVEAQSPKSTEKWSGVPDGRGLGHEPVCSRQRGEDFWVGVAFAGHQRCGQGDVDIELQLFALASFGQPVQ